MHTVCQTHAFTRAAAAAGMSEDEINDLINLLADDPTAGVIMEGTGGCRKLRVAGRGKGKSGGYRTITFFSGDNMPVFLVTAFGKGAKANLTKAERNKLKELTKLIVEEYRVRVTAIGARR